MSSFIICVFVFLNHVSLRSLYYFYQKTFKHLSNFSLSAKNLRNCIFLTDKNLIRQFSDCVFVIKKFDDTINCKMILIVSLDIINRKKLKSNQFLSTKYSENSLKTNFARASKSYLQRKNGQTHYIPHSILCICGGARLCWCVESNTIRTQERQFVTRCINRFPPPPIIVHLSLSYHFFGNQSSIGKQGTHQRQIKAVIIGTRKVRMILMRVKCVLMKTLTLAWRKNSWNLASMSIIT